MRAKLFLYKIYKASCKVYAAAFRNGIGNICTTILPMMQSEHHWERVLIYHKEANQTLTGVIEKVDILCKSYTDSI